MDKNPADKPTLPFPNEVRYTTSNAEQERMAIQHLADARHHLDAHDAQNAAMAAYIAYSFSTIPEIKASAYKAWAYIVKNATRGEIDAHLTDILRNEPEESDFWNMALAVKWWNGNYAAEPKKYVM